MSLFTFKKLIGHLVMPLPIVIILLSLGLILLFWTQRQKLAKSCLFSGTLLLILLSSQPVSDSMLAPFEQDYGEIKNVPKDLDFIVVLGCGHISEENRPITSQLFSCSTLRVNEALRVQQLAPNSKIIFSSGNINDPETNANMMLKLALSLGYPRDNFIISNIGKDTAEEAEALSSLIIGTKTALVTQASHMSRSVKLFASHGVVVIPAPTRFMVKNQDARSKNYLSWFPSAVSLRKSEISFYELMGNIWVNLKIWWQS